MVRQVDDGLLSLGQLRRCGFQFFQDQLRVQYDCRHHAPELIVQLRREPRFFVLGNAHKVVRQLGQLGRPLLDHLRQSFVGCLQCAFGLLAIGDIGGNTNQADDISRGIEPRCLGGELCPGDTVDGNRLFRAHALSRAQDPQVVLPDPFRLIGIGDVLGQCLSNEVLR